MARLTLGGSILAALTTALAVVPGTALADPPFQIHDRLSGTEQFTFCDISGVVEFVLTSNYTIFANGTSQVTLSNRLTYTNTQNGRSMRAQAAGRQTFGAQIIDEAAGTITFPTSFEGIPQKLQTAHGSVLIRDAGFMSVTATYDLETFELISVDYAFHGPHPQTESEYAQFCEIVTEALG